MTVPSSRHSGESAPKEAPLGCRNLTEGNAKPVSCSHEAAVCLSPSQPQEWDALHRRDLESRPADMAALERPDRRLCEEVRCASVGLVRNARCHGIGHRARKGHQGMEARLEARTDRSHESTVARLVRRDRRLTHSIRHTGESRYPVLPLSIGKPKLRSGRPELPIHRSWIPAFSGMTGFCLPAPTTHFFSKEAL